MKTAPTKESQNRDILAHLKRGHSLTPLNALTRYGCFRLSARIYELRNGKYDGVKHPIVAVPEHLKNGKTVAKYKLGKSEAPIEGDKFQPGDVCWWWDAMFLGRMQVMIISPKGCHSVSESKISYEALSVDDIKNDNVKYGWAPTDNDLQLIYRP